MKAKNNKKGFTLTELLVTVGIIIILTAVSMVAVVHYMNNLKVTEMDATAREVFVAAQNHMTAAKASGQWDSFIKANANNESALGTLMINAPADKPKDLEWPVGGGNEKHSYRCIEYNPNESGVLDTSILQHMLPFGAIDEQVRTDSSYVIEYDANTATVYSVFYTDNVKFVEKKDVDELNSTGGRTDSETGRNTRRDYKKGDKRVVIGYYGGAMVKNLIAETLEKPVLIIENEDQLKVKIIDQNYFKKIGDATTQLKTNVKVSITGEESKNTEKFMLELIDNDTKPEKKDKTKDPWWTVTETGNGVMQALEYTLVLDDITTKEGHFTNIFKGLIPGENFVIDVQVGSNYVLSQSVNLRGSSNSLFASNVADSNDAAGITSNVEVDCVRHLQNISPLCSKLPTTVQSTESGNNTKRRLVRNVKQTKDIDWDKSYFKDKSIVSFVGANYGKDSFKGIKNSLLKSYNGQGKKISNFKINGGDAGLFQSVGDAQRKDIELKISNLLLVDFNVKGSGNVGTLVGTAYEGAKLTIDNVGAYISSGEKYMSGDYGVTGSIGEYSVGGLVGSVSESIRNDTELVISDSFASVPVKMNNTTDNSNGGVGGIIGSIGLRKPVKITNTYSGGCTTDGKYDNNNYNIDGNKASAGGLIGKTWYKIIVDNCYSTCSVKGNKAGGFIGVDLNKDSQYKNCYATGLVSGTKAGAFSGSDLNDIKECFYLEGINGEMTGGDNLIKGKSYADLSVKNTKENETHNYDTSLNEKSFPFKTVNKNGIILTGKEIGKIAGVHYGDWPKLVGKIKDKSFAYKEVMQDDSVHWYVVGPEFSDFGKMSIGKSYDDLVTAKGKYVKDTSYGFLSSTKMKPGDFFKGGSDIKDYADFPKGDETVTIDGMSYYYYKINDEKANTDSGSAVDGMVVLPTCKIDTNKRETVTYMYNPNFAAAMYSEADGTPSKPYQIRSDAQLRNINSRDIYYNLSYKQTCDINLNHSSSDPAPFDPIGGEFGFGGTYDGKTAKGSECYNIESIKIEFHPNSSNSRVGGLFGKILQRGSISNINLETGNVVASNHAENVGSIAGINMGTISHCTSKLNVITEKRNSNIDIGGLVGTLKGGTISDSQFLGNIKSTMSSIGLKVKLGGISGSIYGECQIANCSSTATINNTEGGDIGGVVGLAQGGTITKSSFKGTIASDAKDLATNTSADSNVGGFVGSTDDVEITNCSSEGKLEKISATTLGGFVGSINNGKIEQCWSRGTIKNTLGGTFGGFVGIKDYNGILQNSYAATEFPKENSTDNPVKFNTVGLFAGMVNNTSLWTKNPQIQNCHSIELQRSGNKVEKVLSSYKFIQGYGIGYARNYCYQYSKPPSSITGVYYVNDPATYSLLEKFVGWDNTIWKIDKDKGYPVLIDNPEK